MKKLILVLLSCLATLSRAADGVAIRSNGGYGTNVNLRTPSMQGIPRDGTVNGYLYLAPDDTVRQTLNGSGWTNLDVAKITGLSTNFSNSTNSAPDVGQLTRLPLWLNYSNNYPMTVLAVGDSLAISPSISEQVAKRLQERFGANGYVTDNYLSTEPWATNSSGTIDAGPGTSWDSGGTNWFGRYKVMMGNGESVAYGSSLKPNGYLSDQCQVFWIGHPGGGTFDLQVKANGGAWTTIKTLTGLSASRTGGYTNVAVSFNYNRFRVINTEAKTNWFLFTAPYYSGMGSQVQSGCGVRFAGFGYGGLSMDSWTNVPAIIKDVVLTNLNPALIISHNLEEANPIELQWLPEYFRWLSLMRGKADVTVVGNYDFGPSLDPTNGVLERQMWYTNAAARNFPFFNLETAVGGFTNAYTNGFLMSWANPHPNTVGQIAMARLYEQRFDMGRFWLPSETTPPYSLSLRRYDTTNSPLSVYKSDLSGSSSAFIGGEGNNGYLAFGADGTYLKSAVFGSQSYTFLNSPSASAGPYFQRGSGGTALGNFDSNGRLYLNIGLNAAAGTSNYLGGTAVATSGFGSRSNLYVIMPTNAAAASYGIIATGVEGGTTAHTKWQPQPQFELASAVYTNRWSVDESGDAEMTTNYFTYTVPVTANYQVNLAFSTIGEGGGTVDGGSQSETTIKWTDPFASLNNVSPGIDTRTVGVGSGYNNGSCISPYVVFAKAGSLLIVSNYSQNSYDGGGDTKMTNYVSVSVRGAP